MENIAKDTKKFLTNDTTQKFLTTIAVVIILQVAGIIPKETVNTLLRWSVAGFWGANGLDLLTNLR